MVKAARKCLVFPSSQVLEHSENYPPFFSFHPFYPVHFFLLCPFGFFFLPFLQGRREDEEFETGRVYMCGGAHGRVQSLTGQPTTRQG